MSRLFTQQRQHAIADLIAHTGQATVEELAQQFAVSAATIRRDLEDLHQQGRIQRAHGGALRVQRAMPETPLLYRTNDASDAKRRIGIAAAALIPEGATVVLTSGTTTAAVAQALVDREHLTVITNALNVINILIDAHGVNLVVLGGVLRRSEQSLLGFLTEQALADLRADMLFIGAHAISLEFGLSADDFSEIATDRAILNVATQRVLVADNTKFHKVSSVRLAPLALFQTIVTDDGLEIETLDQLREREIEVVVA